MDAVAKTPACQGGKDPIGGCACDPVAAAWTLF
jgi:hypothetical protein